MIVTFTPAEGERRVYEFKPQKLMSVESETIERLTGRPYLEAVQAVQQGSALARRALVYVLEKRTHPTLSWAAFDFPFDAVVVELDREELEATIAALATAPGLTEEQRAEVSAALEAALAEAPEPLGKAHEPNDASST